MKKNDPVKHIMSTNLVTLALNGTFSAAKNALEENNIHHVPVLDGNKLEGIITKIDILKYSFSDAFVSNTEQQNPALDSAVTLSDIMTKDITTINENDSIRQAAEILAKNNFNGLPVLNNSGILVGMVTSKDIMSYLLEQY